MKKVSLIPLVCLLLISGCATPQATRQAQFLSDNYNEQVEKDIFVISLIDARPDKEKDLQGLLSNKPTFDFFVMNPLKAKGYTPKFIKVDTLENPRHFPTQTGNCPQPKIDSVPSKDPQPPDTFQIKRETVPTIR